MDPNNRFFEKEVDSLARQIAKERIAPGASERDKNVVFPREAIKTLGESGILGMIAAENLGGSGAGRAALASVISVLGGACASTALVALSHLIAEKAVEVAATEIAKDQWLPLMVSGQALGAFAVHEPDSGSNAGAITTTAKKEGGHYIINGSKFFITSAGEADIYLVLVKTETENGAPAMSTLLIEKDTHGLSFGNPEDKMGLRSSLSREMFFTDCRVPVSNLLGSEGGGNQVMGGHGYCRDYTVESLFRDARGLMLHFKTSEWLRQDVAKAALGL